MKKNRVIGVITALLLCFSISIPSQAQSINGKARDRVIMQNGNSIQRIYQGQNVAFVYTHDITFHYDSAHVYTVEVEHGKNVAAYGNTLAATKGINVSSYTPYGAAGAWQLVGWKVGDDTANAAGVSNTIASTVKADLYAVWAKDCTSYFNFNGGSCTAWNSFGTDWYARGSAYYNNGNITPFSVKLPTVARANYTLTSITNNGAGSYAAGGTYNLTDKATFICNWQAQAKTNPVEWVKSPSYVLDHTAFPAFASGGYVMWHGPRYVRNVRVKGTKYGYDYGGYIGNEYHPYINNAPNQKITIYGLRSADPNDMVFLAQREVSPYMTPSSGREYDYGIGNIPINGEYWGIRIYSDYYNFCSLPNSQGSWNTFAPHYMEIDF